MKSKLELAEKVGGHETTLLTPPNIDGWLYLSQVIAPLILLRVITLILQAMNITILV